MTALRAPSRIQKELGDITRKPIPGLTVEPQEDNLFLWKCSIKASNDSPYKGGTFHFNLTLPENFPFKAPSVQFTTKIYHPGINEEGSICVPVLRDQWKPAISLSSGMSLLFLISRMLNHFVRSLMTVVLEIISEKVNNPSPDDPYEPEIAAQLKDDKSRFLATAKEWTKKHATS
ncbi:hypothetical protein EIP91_002433 [Steccherinum ochraceum]|uniref:UBC core domain-containing protein n=1 Tax=Steccherinum ochraceum TaxID=92696 RepID=A0A4R0RPA2_9APHY|nr:hypothetical protein EIP91_002433 [Steccherinum ochraceum]